MGYLICDTCNDVYELHDGESPNDIDACQCGGNLEYYDTLHEFVTQFYDSTSFGDHEWNLLLKKGYKQLEKKNRDLEEEYSKLKDANLELKNEMEELKDFYQKLKDINTEVEEENVELKDKITSVKDKCMSLESENERLRVNYEETREKLSKLNGLEIEGSKVTEASKNNPDTKNLKLKDNHVNKSDDSDLKEKLKKLMNDNEELKKELKHTDFKLGNLRQYNRGLESKNSELKQDIMRLKEIEDDYINLNHKYNSLKDQYQELNEHSNKLEEHFNSNKENEILKEMEAHYNDLSKKYKDLENYNQKLLTKDSKLSKNYNKLKNIFLEVEKENLKLKESNDNSSKLENKYNKLHNDFLKLSDENTALDGELSELKDNMSFMREKNLELKSIKDENEKHLLELKDNNRGLMEKYLKLETKFTNLKDENFKLMKTDSSELKTRYNDLNTNYYRLKVECNDLRERYVALKNKNKSPAIKVDFSGKDDATLKTHIVCEDCGQKLPLFQFYRTKSNERGYTERCKGCIRKRKAVQGLVELSKYIELDMPFSKEELRNVIREQPFSIFENYMWVLLELDILSYLEDEDKYILRGNDNLKGFCGTYGISLEL
ncbi:hypothetical protein [Methanobacterium sp. ACI-7]|uniref:hypothetical protein n=1 Tax=unclassified Methanobacterium TaxID=2627676 RepID=UPI0039C34621